MSKPNSAEEHLESLVTEFVEAVDGTRNPNPKIANKFAMVIHRLGREFGASEEGKKKLLSLVSHRSNSVRLWASRYCLLFYPAEAKEALNSIIQNDRVLDFEAKIMLQEFEKGRIT